MSPVGFSGVVLTGGRSRRMGADKAFLAPGDGGPVLVVRARDALVAAGAAECVAVGGDGARLAALGFRPVADVSSYPGPLEGVATGLAAATQELAVVLSCDLPAIDAATVESLVARLAAAPAADAVVPVVDGFPQVLVAAYRRRVAPSLLAAFVAGERSLRRALAARPVVEWQPPATAAFVDLDRPEDVEQYARSRRA